MHVSGPVPGLCDAVVQLYDGHGGKHAARYCVANLVPYVEEAFFAHPRAKPHAPNGDRDALALDVDKDTGFHPALDDAVVAAFERLDAEIKRDDPSGTTAAVRWNVVGRPNRPSRVTSTGVVTDVRFAPGAHVTNTFAIPAWPSRAGPTTPLAGSIRITCPQVRSQSTVKFAGRGPRFRIVRSVVTARPPTTTPMSSEPVTTASPHGACAASGIVAVPASDWMTSVS